MSALTTPRMGRRVAHVVVEQFDAHQAGVYRGERNTWLIMAHTSCGERRAQFIRWALSAHRGMTRCLVEYRRAANSPFKALTVQA